MIKLTKTPILPNCLCQMAFFGTTVHFIIQKLKSKHLVCLSFLWWVFFEVNERKYFTHIPGLSKRQIQVEDKIKFCTLLRKPEFYEKWEKIVKLPCQNCQPVLLWDLGSPCWLLKNLPLKVSFYDYDFWLAWKKL